ncbi:class II aldolase/adducin family protein [Microvirga sp. 0TCS3.31]
MNSDIGKNIVSEEALRGGIVEASREADRQHLNSGTAGNISVRCKDRMLITPTGVRVSDLTMDKIVLTDFEGTFEGTWRPSSEWMMHAAIYKAIPEAGAVVHTHSDHCVAIACLREAIPSFHYMLASFGGSDVPCAEYAPFGSPELAAAAVTALKDRSACLLANHGAICFGESLPVALAKAAKLESLARQYWLARAIGAPVLLDASEMSEVHARYKGYGQPSSAVP